MVAVLTAAGPRGLTSRELVVSADVVAPSTYISELRANGYAIGPAIMERTTAGGARVYRYILGPRQPVAGQQVLV